MRSLFGVKRVNGSGQRVLLFALECALGILAVILVSALAHWSGWLLPVSVLLYLLIVVPTALLCGFWQAAIVSLSAVLVHAYLAARQPLYLRLGLNGPTKKESSCSIQSLSRISSSCGRQSSKR